MGLRAQIGSVAGHGEGSAVNAEGGSTLKLAAISPTLIVEDNYLTATELARVLDGWSIETRCASRVSEARNLARELHPKLALVDINLAGGFEGLELARELQALYHSKIVFVTAYSVRDLMHRMSGAEHITVLFKPVEREVLSAVLSRLCAAYESAH